VASQYQIPHTTVNPTLVVVLSNEGTSHSRTIEPDSVMQRMFFILPAQAEHGDGSPSQIERVTAFQKR